MSRGQCAIVCAFLGAIAVAVFIVAFDLGSGGLSSEREIHQHARGIFVLVGAAGGYLLGGLLGGPSAPGVPSKLGKTEIHEQDL